MPPITLEFIESKQTELSLLIAKFKEQPATPATTQSGIAAAMQGLEGSASAPEGAVAPPDVPATGFDVGQKVKVVTDLDKLGVLVKRHAGKAGTITKKEPGSNHWHVMVRAGGLQLFAEDQIERVAA